MNHVSEVELNLEKLGIAVPEAPKALAAYVMCVRVGNLVFTSGQIATVAGELRWKGKVGRDVTIEQGYEAARACALNCLAVLKAELGDLDRVERVVKVTGYVNSADGFSMQPKVINGASDLLVAAFGERGKHARAAVGVNELPLDTACEVEVIVAVKA
jgi:enamine deaminase RidA (YjgF/YER057c/UK114 family)